MAHQEMQVDWRTQQCRQSRGMEGQEGLTGHTPAACTPTRSPGQRARSRCMLGKKCTESQQPDPQADPPPPGQAPPAPGLFEGPTVHVTRSGLGGLRKRVGPYDPAVRRWLEDCRDQMLEVLGGPSYPWFTLELADAVQEG